jgi:error-prone DNA polymerase
MKLLISNRKKFYSSINELRNVGISNATLEKLADADAFRSIGLDRRQALWEISCNDQPIGMFSGQQTSNKDEEQVSLPKMTLPEHVVQDYAATSFSLKAHPISFIREKLQQLHIVSNKELNIMSDGDTVKVAGLVIVRQRPGTAKGICFITIEDETGCANLVVFENLFNKYRKEILQSRLLMVEGKLQREGEVIHVIVKTCYDLSKLLRHLISSQKDNDHLPTHALADQKPSLPNSERNKEIEASESVQLKIFPAFNTVLPIFLFTYYSLLALINTLIVNFIY